MAVLINESDMSVAWLKSITYLLEKGGRDVNLSVVFKNIHENHGIRETLDEFLLESCRLGKQDVASVYTVANTLFPKELYLPKLGEKAREHLYEMHRLGYEYGKRLPANSSGTYFHRMTHWEENGARINQLENIIQRLKRQYTSNRRWSSIYEMTTSSKLDELSEDVRIYNPLKDRKIMGFPCLSHISITLSDSYLHLTALYRNQHFIRKAYGNYLGLSHLLQYICDATGFLPGEIMCIASHADAELHEFTKVRVQGLVNVASKFF
jgi:thymidylate synthase